MIIINIYLNILKLLQLQIPHFSIQRGIKVHKLQGLVNLMFHLH